MIIVTGDMNKKVNWTRQSGQRKNGRKTRIAMRTITEKLKAL